MMHATECRKPLSTVALVCGLRLRRHSNQLDRCDRSSSPMLIGPGLSSPVQRHPALRPFDVGVVLVVAVLLDQLPPRAALAADVHERALLAHDSRKAVRVVAEARGVARRGTIGYSTSAWNVSGFSRPSCHAKTPPCAMTERGGWSSMKKWTRSMPWLIHWSGMPLENSRYRRNSKYRLRIERPIAAWSSATSSSRYPASRICFTSGRPRQRGPL